MAWSPYKFRHMAQNWILISNYNLTFSDLCLLIYIYIVKLMSFQSNNGLRKFTTHTKKKKKKIQIHWDIM